MHVTSSWQDASRGYAVVDVAGLDHPGLLGREAHIQARIAATQPDADDAGELFAIEGLRSRRVEVPAGQKLWLRAHVSQIDLLIEWS